MPGFYFHTHALVGIEMELANQTTCCIGVRVGMVNAHGGDVL